jgi:hypothetical protein
MFLSIYSDYINTIDPYMIIIIFLVFNYILCFSLQMYLYFLCSTLVIEIFIIFYLLYLLNY